MPEGPEVARLVFVYGTLRRGECNDIARYSPTPVPVGAGETSGVLYDLGPYPGALFGGESTLVGEVYRVTPEVERMLDHLEGVQDDGQGEYLRRQVEVRVQGRWLRCLAYEIQLVRVQGAARIVSGDWLRRGVTGAADPQ